MNHLNLALKTAKIPFYTEGVTFQNKIQPIGVKI